MSSSDSLFLFEIKIEDFVSYIKCKEFGILCTFSDLFRLNIKDPRILNKHTKEQTMLTRKSTTKTTQKFPKSKMQASSSIIISCGVQRLITKMEKSPLIIFLRRKSRSFKEYGLTHYQWEKLYIDYLRIVEFSREHPKPITSIKECTILNDKTKQKIACFKTTVKFSIVINQSAVVLNTALNRSPSVSDTSYDVEDSKYNKKKTERTGSKSCNDSIPTVTPLNNEEDLPKNISICPFKETQGIYPNKPKINEKRLWIKSALNSLIKSATDLNKQKFPIMRISKSISSIKSISTFKKTNILNYIFADANGPYKQVYYVGYLTVEAVDSKDKVSLGKSSKEHTSEKSSGSKSQTSHRTNDSKVGGNSSSSSSSSNLESTCVFNKPAELNITDCKKVNCENRVHRRVPTPPDRQVLLNLENMYRECCDKTEKVEEMVGGVTAKMKFGKDPCFCACECTFGYKKTTYCGVCGGFEKAGNEFAHKPKYELPFPCPIYHKMVDKNKLKVLSTSGSDSKKKEDSLGQKSVKTGSKSATSSDKRSIAEKKSESEKDKKKVKKDKDDRFRFNYGYKAPQIGHMQCVTPCTGTLGPVPKNMGWLWTAEDVPGVKFNPQWKPGAVHKFVYRLLKMARNPEGVVAKKRRKDAGKKKRPLKRPLLVVNKKNGEYTVTMETMKNYAKPRQLNQHPYEDKPVVTYTIGRTEEENNARQKKKERERRRLERAQRLFIQSAFKNMCHEICLKTYQQALGLLPNAEDPRCACYPADPGPDKTNVNVSCSCSEESTSFQSDTDSDEWIIEFTPPNATFDPTFKSKKIVKADKLSQYSYLDFRVKLTDRYGNPVPRFFKGLDGKQQCSDLGGFWSPDHKWLEINVDGYIAPDGRWAPNLFSGPNGETVDGEAGKFQANDGRWLVVGVDGYVDVQGKWQYYSKPKGHITQKKPIKSNYKKVDTKKSKEYHNVLKKSTSSWSCFADVSPLQLSALGITGHGADRKLLIKKLEELVAQGAELKIPPVYGSSSILKRRKKLRHRAPKSSVSVGKCSHKPPSDKGVEAVDEYGNKTYFRLKHYKNKRSQQRLADLVKRGISLSSFHVPCFHSFINSEIMKKQQRNRLKALALQHGYTQT